MAGEPWCARRWQLHIRPDGYARFEGPEGPLELLLELDRGTENRGRLEDKMERYRIMARAVTAPDVVLFCFTSPAREASARQVLGGSPMRVATATLHRHLADPLGPNWLLVPGTRRLRVADLPRTAGREGLVATSFEAGPASRLEGADLAQAASGDETGRDGVP